MWSSIWHGSFGAIANLPLLNSRMVLTPTTPLVHQDVEKHTAEYTARFANPMVSAQRGFVDDIIDPKDTRRLICNDLKVLRTKRLENLPRKHSNIPL